MIVDIVIAVAKQGGVENVINETAGYLKEKGWKIRIVQMIWEEYRWVRDGIEFYPLLKGKKGHDLGELIMAYHNFIIENGAPHIVLAAAWPYMSYLAKSVSGLSGKNIKVLSWLHAPVERYQEAGYGGYGALKFADAHLAISNQIAQQITEHLGQEAIVYNIHNPVDFLKCREIYPNKHAHHMLFVGRISPEKRLDTIIRALAQTKSVWMLDIIGDGEETLKSQYINWAENNQVAQQIIWHGWNENPWQLEIQAEVFVMASEYEGFPLAAIEALACGLPVISTPVSGMTDLIIPGKNGYLFPTGDSGALAEILDALDQNIFPSIQKESCKTSVEKYEQKKALEEFEKIISLI